MVHTVSKKKELYFSRTIQKTAALIIEIKSIGSKILYNLTDYMCISNKKKVTCQSQTRGSTGRITILGPFCSYLQIRESV